MSTFGDSYSYGLGPVDGSRAVPAIELRGVFCATADPGATLALYDGPSLSSPQIVAAFPLTAGTFYLLPFRIQSGIFRPRVQGGTASLTFAFS